MKLCWLLPSDKSGGISPVALSCCRQAAQAGHQTTMLLLAEPSWLSSTEFKVASIGVDAGRPEAPKLLREWLDRYPQDVLFFNGCDEFDVLIPYLPKYTKCVYVVHDTAPPYWKKAVTEEENIEAIIAVSQTVSNKFKHLLKRPEKLFVIHNGCVFPELAEKGTRNDDLIFLGGQNPTKGAFDVLSLWGSLSQSGFDGRLHWFGQTSPKFKARIKQLPEQQQIIVYDYVPRSKIFSTAASSKVLLMLSRVEPFGMSTIEAMGMGCVPVAWDVETGTKEIAINNETGLFAPLGDIKILTQKTLQACTNHKNFEAAVIERARSHFNEEVMWHGYESVIDFVSELQPIQRSKLGQEPVSYKRPVRRFQFLPPRLRSLIREVIGRSPFLGYLFRDMRGW